ncbi:putative serine/threonine-protein kinase VPS15 [Colletotrichum sp. SAR 10_86]|nr:putative serine/threonine-protein kinase VPS15 [Colletotrichum sp. SAR 10_65]KAI8201543.1 putative serine/threonine-protein kinase VPS15 [Colletotrichum sp. SAR 10_76]KAI8220993.1 putative serine/threonine-protein kinase VPS15 [Colletotrichum sp. SAR 10_86]KAI8222730.1 putative serine/threonine-protein kinase VPS15 [Colletotrichum sp. SAR 10_77]
MGQGFSLATPSAGSAGIDIPELSDLVYEKSIGNARFMKSIRARHHDGVALVKVLVKPYTPMPLEKYKRDIEKQRTALADVPNALGFQRIVETETNGYLVRQFLYNSLYDRMSTRPFLEDIEKKWLAFQLLCALRDCHARDIYHGDIKTENTLVTSWNWLYLSDFSSPFKPIMLPDDNPGDFSYYFDTSGRRTCYVAPERFVPADEVDSKDAKLTWAMDVFSAGCVIAEMFLESPIFTLSQLYKYRKGEYDPVISQISRIPDKDLRDMISHMIQLDPERRYSAEQYLDFWKKKVFPEYFYNFLHQYMELITDPSSGNNPISGATRNLGEADDRIDRVFLDFDKISYFLGYQNEKRSTQIESLAGKLGLGHFPIRLNIPNHENYITGASDPPEDDGTLIFLTLIVSSLRNTARAASKIRACDVLLAFSERITDEAKLDRVLPYLMTLLNDKSDLVVIAGLRSVTQLLQLVRVVSPVNSHIFVEYILPRLQGAIVANANIPSPLVRATYASCLGSLANTAARFLELAATLKADGTLTVADPELEPGIEAEAAFDGLFDDAQRELYEMFELHTKALVEDPDVSVRRAFLTSVPNLCLFFGPAEANDILLTHLNTYLNDRDWMLKCAFFETIVSIASLVGSVSLEEFMLPLMVQALTDPEEFVVQAALHSLAQLARLGLLSKTKMWELIDVVVRFTMHPNVWIRESATEFLSEATRFLSPADVRCIVFPMVKQYLKTGMVPEFAELALLDALKRPMSRAVFDQALMWALKTDKGVFWKLSQQIRSFSYGSLPKTITGRASKDTLSKVSRNDEDEQWLDRLRNLGLGPDDEFKLLALREFIYRVSKMKSRDGVDRDPAKLNEVISLKSLGLTPQTVFFDEEPLQQSTFQPDVDQKGPYTIADALLDASMTIDDSTGKRKFAALNSLRTRVVEDQGSSSRDVSRVRSIDPSRRSSTGQGKLTVGSPTDDSASVHDQPYAIRRAIRHQSSALSLLDRKDGNKSIPETGMSGTNAFGEVEGPFAQAPLVRPDMQDRRTSTTSVVTKLRPNHSYEGSDPSILKMLDSMYQDNYPHDIAEFGPMVTPITRRKPNRSVGQSGDDPWRPTGRMVATFAEHTGAINRIVASPDHVFFVTGGDDGNVKVWDSARLEKNITHRSRQTHKHAEGARVLALCFIENTHCFISCASDGSVHIVKVETVSASGVLREIYRVGGNKEGPKGYEPWEVDEDKPEGMLGRFATNIETSGSGNADRGVRAMIAGTGATDDSRDVRHAFIVTGGSDKKLRFWDLSRIESSTVYSGLQVDDPRPTFAASHPTTSMTLNTERIPRQNATASNAAGGTKGKVTGGRPTRSTVISLQHQQLLRSHLDSIMDVALLELPYSMTLSVDRSGVPKMRLTAELIRDSLSYLNPLKERELDLRGHRIPAIENLGVAGPHDSIDFTDNDIQVLGNFPLSPRISTLLLARNRVSSIQPTLPNAIPNLQQLVLAANNLAELADLDALAGFKRLTHLVLADNPVTKRENYRYWVVWRCPTVRFLDYGKVKEAEREKARELFGTAAEPSALASKIMGIKSKTLEVSAANGAAAPSKLSRIKLTDKEKERLKEMIKKADSLQEIIRLEKMLTEGTIPAGVHLDGDATMEG